MNPVAMEDDDRLVDDSRIEVLFALKMGARGLC